jgi:hypothetical protein
MEMFCDRHVGTISTVAKKVSSRPERSAVEGPVHRLSQGNVLGQTCRNNLLRSQQGVIRTRTSVLGTPLKRPDAAYQPQWPVQTRTPTATPPNRRDAAQRSESQSATHSKKTHTEPTSQDYPPPKCNKPTSSKPNNSPFSPLQSPEGSVCSHQTEAPGSPAKQKTHTPL